MDIYNVLFLMTFVLNQEKYVKIGVLKMVSVPEEFVIACLDITEMIALYLLVLVGNSMINKHHLVYHHAHLLIMKIFIQEVV